MGLHGVFYLSATLCLIAALTSFLRGKRYIYGQKPLPVEPKVEDVLFAHDESPAELD